MGRDDDAWAVPNWAYAKEDGTVGNRIDDPRGVHSVLYASSQRLGCLIETLAGFRIGTRSGPANRGYMSERIFLLAGRDKCLYLTSAFVEPGVGDKIIRLRASRSPKEPSERSFHPSCEISET